MVKPYGSALEEITEQEVEMLVLEYWHHHQTVLSGDGQPDFLAQVRRVRANTSTASSRQGFVWGMGHVSDTQTGLIYMRARYYAPSVGRMAKGTPRRLPRPAYSWNCRLRLGRHFWATWKCASAGRGRAGCKRHPGTALLHKCPCGSAQDHLCKKA